MNILAVDDETLALDTVVDSIEKVVPDACVTGFRKAADALAYIQQNPCDVAFLDIKMRGMTGLELAKQLKDVRGDINIIFVTGYSEYSLDAFRLYASDYLLKPATPEAVKQALEHLRTPVRPVHSQRIRFQCFGNFEAFVDNRPLSFRRAKTKELLAYLVDRMGAAATMGELMAILWENSPDTSSKQSNLRNLIADLKSVLNEAGAGNIILKSRNSMALDCRAVDCDYYDFLRHIPCAVNAYHGEYMKQYSWAEVTTAALPQLFMLSRQGGQAL